MAESTSKRLQLLGAFPAPTDEQVKAAVDENMAANPEKYVGPQGPAGANGQTPYIGNNGNWWIGETDTGVSAGGTGGDSSQNANGLTTEQINALDGMFKIASFTADPTAAYAAFKTAFGITDSGDSGGDSGGSGEDSGGDETHTHSYTSSVTTAATCETAGVRTYTCSCGHSYTEAIPATGHTYVDGVCTVCGAADPDAEAVSVRYELAEETAFDGTNYVDTGVTLVEVDRDWTICLDYTPTAKSGKPFDISSDGTGCVYMCFRGGYFLDICCQADYIDISTKLENVKAVITHTVGTDNITVTYLTASTEKTTASLELYDVTAGRFKNSGNIILGADYTKAANFAKGTMHRFVVYNGVLDDTAISEFLGVSA